MDDEQFDRDIANENSLPDPKTTPQDLPEDCGWRIVALPAPQCPVETSQRKFRMAVAEALAPLSRLNLRTIKAD